MSLSFAISQWNHTVRHIFNMHFCHGHGYLHNSLCFYCFAFKSKSKFLLHFFMLLLQKLSCRRAGDTRSQSSTLRRVGLSWEGGMATGSPGLSSLSPKPRDNEGRGIAWGRSIILLLHSQVQPEISTRKEIFHPGGTKGGLLWGTLEAIINLWNFQSLHHRRLFWSGIWLI